MKLHTKSCIKCRQIAYGWDFALDPVGQLAPLPKNFSRLGNENFGFQRSTLSFQNSFLDRLCSRSVDYILLFIGACVSVCASVLYHVYYYGTIYSSWCRVAWRNSYKLIIIRRRVLWWLACNVQPSSDQQDRVVISPCKWRPSYSTLQVYRW